MNKELGRTPNENNFFKTKSPKDEVVAVNPFDQDLNTFNNVQFASVRTPSIKSSATYTHVIPDTNNDDIVTTDSDQTLINKTIVVPINEASGTSFKFTSGGVATTSPQNGDFQYTSIAPLFTTSSGTGVLSPMAFIAYSGTLSNYAEGTSFVGIFPNSISMIANTIYQIEWRLIFQRPNNADLEMRWVFTNAPRNFTYSVNSALGDSLGTITSTHNVWKGSTTTVVAAPFGTEYVVVGGSALCHTLSGTTLTPQCRIDRDDIGATFALASGSYMKILPITAAGSFGTFSVGWS